MISKLIDSLRGIGLELTAQDIADILWLAYQMEKADVLGAEKPPGESKISGSSDATSPSDQRARLSEKEVEESSPVPTPSPAPSGINIHLSSNQVGSMLPEGQSGLPFRSPAVPALQNALGIARSLRPLKRQVPSRTQFLLDESATVKRVAEQGLWMPVLRPAPGRWLEVALVIDEGKSMAIWQRTVSEFCLLLERQGAFRNVRIWGLVTDADDGPAYIHTVTGITARGKSQRSPRELLDPTGQRLILVVTDCVSPAWHSGAVTRSLSMWGRNNPVAIIQVLPRRLWLRTSLATAGRVGLHALFPGAPNAQLEVRQSGHWFTGRHPTWLPMPIVTLESKSLATWARMITGAEDAWAQGLILEASVAGNGQDTHLGENILEKEVYPPLTAQECLERFHSTASPMAYQLAHLLASAPISLPIIRLIQQTMLPQSNQVHIAEIFLSGLLEEVTPNAEETDPDYIQYDFLNGVRELLLNSVPVTHSLQVLKEVSDYVEHRIGQSFDFRALLADPTYSEGKAIAEGSRPFATVAAKVLRRLGGKFATLATRLEQVLVSSSVEQYRHIRKEDWGDAPHIEQFYGREKEVDLLKRWLVDEHCKVIAITGMGGSGKTALAVEAARQIQDQFEYFYWRSLKHASPMESFLSGSIRFLSDQAMIELPEDTDLQINMLIGYLQSHRCLLVLDDLTSIMMSGESGRYREGYEGYGKLIVRLAEAAHQGCLLLISREKPNEVAHLEGKAVPVRSLILSGLELNEAIKILEDKGIYGSVNDLQALINHYAGNPLALKLVAEPIRELFGGDVADFLERGEPLISDISNLLDQQFQRLSALEQEIIYWLAIEREAVALDVLREDLADPISKREILTALGSLRRRSMIESSGTASFTMQAVIMEYVTDRFIEQICRELDTERISLFASHALIKAQSKDYVRESQIRLILEPIADQLLSTYGKEGSEKKLKNILSTLRETNPLKPVYAAGNILNLLIYLKADLRGYDFSHLIVWQAYLQGANLREVNFTRVNFVNSLFTETFGRIPSLAFSPDGMILAAGTAEGTIRFWRALDGLPLITCEGHTDWINSIAFSPSGQLLVSGSDDRSIRLWDVSTGRCLKILRGDTQRVRSVAFSPDGQLLVSGSDDQSIRLWEVGTGQCLKVLMGHTNRVQSVAFSPDGQLLVSGSDDQSIRLWDVSTGRCLKILRGDTQRVRSVAFSPDGQLLVSGSDDQSIRLWEVSTGQCLKVLMGHTNRVRSVAFSPDGQLLVSGSDDQSIRLWEVSTGASLRTLIGARPDERPYEHMNITGVTGLTNAQKDVLRSLGAIEEWKDPTAEVPVGVS